MYLILAPSLMYMERDVSKSFGPKKYAGRFFEPNRIDVADTRTPGWQNRMEGFQLPTPTPTPMITPTPTPMITPTPTPTPTPTLTKTRTGHDVSDEHRD